MLLSNRESRCRRSICFRTTNRRQRCRRSLRTADSSVTCCARSGSEPSALLHYRAAISRSAAGLGCVKTQTCCDAVEWCSQGSDVHHLSREVRLSALTERRCRNLDNSEILALLARLLPCVMSRGDLVARWNRIPTIFWSVHVFTHPGSCVDGAPASSAELAW